MLQIFEKIAEKIAHKRVFLTFLSLILIQTFALAQNDSKITIQQKNITVIDALKTVEKQSKKSINYSDSELKGKVIAHLDRHAALPLHLGELHHQDGVLPGQAHQHHQPQLGVNAQGRVADDQAQQGAQQGHGDGDDDGDRHRPALILRHQEQVAEEQGHAHQQHDLAVILPFLVAHVRPGDGIILRQRKGLNLVHQLSAADAWLGLGGHFRGHELVEAGYLPRSDHVGQGGYGAERHHLALVVLDVGVHDVVDAGAVFRRGLHLHLERVADQVEIIDVHGGQLALERRENAVHGHVHALRLFTVDVQEKLGRVRLIRAAGVHGPWQLVDLVQQFVRHAFQVLGRKPSIPPTLWA